MNQSSEKPTLRLSADAGFFGEETYQAAVERLDPYFRVGGGLFVEFSEAYEAKVVLEFAWATFQAIPPSIIAAILYDVLKTKFLQIRGGQRTKFELIFKENPYERSVHAQIETSDPEDLREALATVQEVVSQIPEGRSVQFDNENHQWKWGEPFGPYQYRSQLLTSMA